MLGVERRLVSSERRKAVQTLETEKSIEREERNGTLAEGSVSQPAPLSPELTARTHDQIPINILAPYQLDWLLAKL